MSKTGGPQQGRADGLPCAWRPRKDTGCVKPQNRLLDFFKPRFPPLKWRNAISSRQKIMRRGKEAQHIGGTCGQVAGGQVMQGAWTSSLFGSIY